MSATGQELPVVDVVKVTDEITAIDLEGELDIANAPEVIRQAQRLLGDGRHLIINLSDATFIDSSIVNALFTVNAAAAGQDRRCVLQFGTHPGVERVLSITGADRKLACAPSRQKAIDLINSYISDAPPHSRGDEWR